MTIDIEITPENRISALVIEVSRLQKENFELRSAVIALQQNLIDEDFKVGGTD
jgi:hypothetical protein